MLTAKRIEEYTERGYSPRKLIKSPRNKAKNWQVKTAMGMTDPKKFDEDLIELPRYIWNLAEQIDDSEYVERHMKQAEAMVTSLKYKKKFERCRIWLIVSIILGFYSTFFALSAYFERF